MNRQQIESLGEIAATKRHLHPAQFRPNRSGGSAYMPAKWLLAKILELMGSPAVRFVLWDGQEVALSPATAVARFRIAPDHIDTSERLSSRKSKDDFGSKARSRVS